MRCSTLAPAAVKYVVQNQTWIRSSAGGARVAADIRTRKLSSRIFSCHMQPISLASRMRVMKSSVRSLGHICLTVAYAAVEVTSTIPRDTCCDSISTRLSAAICYTYMKPKVAIGHIIRQLTVKEQIVSARRVFWLHRATAFFLQTHTIHLANVEVVRPPTDMRQITNLLLHCISPPKLRLGGGLTIESNVSHWLIVSEARKKTPASTDSSAQKQPRLV